MNITISVPEISDVPTMVSWGKNNRELRAGEDFGWYSSKIIKRWIKDPRQDVMLVAKDGTVLVGMCLVHYMREWSYCAGLFVVKKYRGCGIGTLLLKKATKMIKKLGITSFSLLVEEHNKKAQDFYSSLGFKKGFTLTWMEKKLT